MKVNEKIIALFFLLLAITSVAQGQEATVADNSLIHQRNLHTHSGIVDTAENPDEHREESFARRHHLTH